MNNELRECPIHGLTKHVFYAKSSHNGQWKCMKCESEASVLKNQKYKLRALQYKGCKCEKCGYDRNIAALEFHHLDPAQKDFGISATHRCWEEVKTELDKCILVCANCHRELHNPQATIEYLEKAIEEHKDLIQIKQTKAKGCKYKFTLEEVNSKYEELKSWQLVADFYNISISTLKRHRLELSKQK